MKGAIWLYFVFSLGLSTVTLQPPHAPPDTAPNFRVVLLGTGSPNPRPDRFGPSILVEAGSERLVFDCG